MRISILAVGQDKAGPETELAGDYAGRIERTGRSVGITAVRSDTFAESRHKTSPERKRQESERLTEALDPRSKVVVLSERGRQFSSAEFASFLGRHLDDGTPELSFLIGGADGHAEELEQRADHRIALGAMTWPHRLVRVMICEQIYRAVTILTNHPYHRQ